MNSAMEILLSLMSWFQQADEVLAIIFPEHLRTFQTARSERGSHHEDYTAKHSSSDFFTDPDSFLSDCVLFLPMITEFTTLP